MKILYYEESGKPLPGLVTPDGIVPLSEHLTDYYGKYQHRPLTNDDIIALKNSDLAVLDPNDILQEDEIEICPCVPMPSKIICIGLNYRKHAIESGMAIPPIPVVFSKYNNTLTKYGSDIPLGTEGEEFDYEVELGVIIGKKGKNISKDDALSHVLGYCVANDLSCRDLQLRSSQWLLGKSLDRFLPLGKYLVTADEVGDPQNLKLTCTLNGELRQNSNTADMIFSVTEIIEFLSRHMTLEPGDLIITGTPEGVIMGLPEKNWLKPGDIVKVEIEKLGYTVNRMA
ncbi:MAG: fumarylacetoacetate hydrolase family protein [Candidatus Pedobacter colombiensis]|uniref:Fumarylacetoacetate hydrolase family protein n=1 Tax=Candidatus Pedobacter colombiensis TaxID=3121371 RepID=A0AAJ5W942_9SPHI|nr:fumarylacetoacetate hydrolase family protein [Pedobacter sp.]WEK21008.1 MAG: fumarylacetoacetate hydrolase family protein [Pedobacter sp.]